MLRSEHRVTRKEKASSTSGASINNLVWLLWYSHLTVVGKKCIIPVLISY
jgi:hypothetical protein